MTDVNPQPTTGPSDGGRERRGGRQPAAGDRPAEDKAFSGSPSGGDKPVVTADQAADAGLQLQREAMQAGQEMMRMGRRAATQSSELWRQSFEPLAAWQSEMRRWFDHTWGQMTGMGLLRPLQTARPFGGGAAAVLMGVPAADLEETDDAYRLCIEVPGMASEDLKLDVKDGSLAVSGQKTQEQSDSAAAYRISERRYGSFQRIFPLPADVDRNRIDAKLEAGLLTITLPKTSPANSGERKIEVHG
jgi:HSP20 family molecular chaperone IbpA